MHFSYHAVVNKIADAEISIFVIKDAVADVIYYYIRGCYCGCKCFDSYHSSTKYALFMIQGTKEEKRKKK